MMNLHAENVLELDVDTEHHGLIAARKKQSLSENLLEGILASQDETIAFAHEFDELDGEI